ncbi:Nuclear transport factor 2 family protein [Candidatus Cyrtobacter comes]|uniref:Nuclear transport factor 2 family protein n=1 Tax=Candidatus Cyrtobacter comes TaxID=675776 RepID=A0ABU5L6N4_9RICK|nr:nuclear transport factor 2 family protein [Candidatus Cyrtobacter comes]MDZ5761792.1 Nuclear transport factor 2 family protein [Candidatus Cyrtobacter comes]
MNTTDNVSLAESYYNAMLAKDFDRMASYLHDNVYFIGPLVEMHGKDAVVTAVKNFGRSLQDIYIRSRFADGDQIMFAYDMVVPDPIGKFRSAVLMNSRIGSSLKSNCFMTPDPFKKSEMRFLKTDSS